MGMRNGGCKRIGGIGSFHARGGQKTLHHRLHLILGSVTDANHALLDVIGGVFRNVEPPLRACQKRNRARMTDLERRLRILVYERLLHCDGDGPKVGNHRAEPIMQGQQPVAQILLRAGRKDTMSHMGEPCAFHGDDAPAHAAKTRIKPHNANRNWHGRFVPLMFERCTPPCPVCGTGRHMVRRRINGMIAPEREARMTIDFTVKPRMEWHSKRPFAIARLPVDYAHDLARLALEREEQIKELPVSRGWEHREADNPTGSRYQAYNAFLLSAQCLPLYFALRATLSFFLRELRMAETFTTVTSWYNVHREGQRLQRHLHEAPFIGSFIAWGEGSTTTYGPYPKSSPYDHAFSNVDGHLLVTLGPRHHHEVSVWHDPDHPRVSYAFDIHKYDTIPHDRYPHGRPFIPLTGRGFSGA